MLARRLARLAVSAAVIALVGLLAARWQSRQPPGSVARRFEYAGHERAYLLHPGSATPKTALVLLLHGLGGYGGGIERRTRFDDAAERAGAVVAYPDAIAAHWNDGWWDSSSDDVGFLSALAAALVNEFGIDPRRVYVAGFSNGAAMAHRLACESDRFAALAAVSGNLSEHIAGSCSNGDPISVLAVQGTDDPIVPYGVELTRSMAHWLAHDGCAEPAESVQLPDIDPSDGTRVSLQAHAHCRAGAEVALYTITGGGHTWPGEDFQWLRFRRPGNISRDFDLNQTLLDFFLRHPKR
jgi:polyhydroxybutyrate depolymerase